MAVHTDMRLQNQVIYSIYVRNHTPEGTFRAVIADLDRIRALGTDIIWFMPIHPIGVKGKKGSLGCPYANRDYRTVNPEYGTMEDFKTLVAEIHARGMKCMIDVVYNHTSPDSTLLAEHPDFFYRKADGATGNRVGDWTDVIDLDYGNRALWDYQIESLCMWAEIVDGFRCDVASLVPVAFWQAAREAVERVRPGCIWLAETVHRSFNCFMRRNGVHAENDYDMFSAFDMEYDYDIREVFDQYLAGTARLGQWLDLMNFQEALYPENYNKMRCLENHDQPRIASFVKDEKALRNYTAFLYFLKGTTLIYAGQEFADAHLPSLFEKDVFSRDTGRDLSAELRRLYAIKQRFGADDHFLARADDAHDIAILERMGKNGHFYGVFSLRAAQAEVAVDAPDGTYVNLIDDAPIPVREGKLHCAGNPIIFRV